MASSLFKGSLFLSSSLILAFNALPARGVQIDFSNPDGFLTNSHPNNLGATMTYENAITDGSTTLDLLVEVVDSYTEDKLDKNGSISSEIGQINIASSTSTRFKFKLLKANDNTPHTINSIDFFLLDVDGNNSSGGAIEKVTLYSAANYKIVDETPFLTVNDIGDRLEITATNNAVTNPDANTTPNISSNPAPNPDYTLTPDQEKHTINFAYSNVSEFELGYEIIGGSKSRNFQFTGEIFFDEPATPVAFPPVPFEFSPSLGLLLSGGSLLGINYLKKKKQL